jgi:NADPH2:quinone reductase
MRVIRVRTYGQPEVLRLEEADEPIAAAEQVLVDVELAGVIYGDVIVRSGSYPLPLPWVPGTEVGGRVRQIGPGVDPSLLGALVVATTHENVGGYAELALANAVNVFVVPDGLALEQAIAVFQAGAVAAGLLAATKVQPGDRVLVTAAAGRIGSLLVQLTSAAGATAIAATTGADKLNAVAAAGAHHAVDYGAPDWAAQVCQATDGAGCDVVLDAVGGKIGQQAIDSAADGHGRIGIYGVASNTWTALDAAQIVQRGLTIIGALGVIFSKSPAEQRADAEHALALTAAGRLRPRIHAIHPLRRAADAHTELQQRRSIGAILLAPSMHRA